MAESNHDKIVKEIERKMAGDTFFKSEQEKKEKLFEYGEDDAPDEDFMANGGQPSNKIIVDIDKRAADSALEQIYNFYVNSYIQPRMHFDTFDKVSERKLNFQPFLLFTKNFNILKTIFSIDKVKFFFKKYANFGKYLTKENFIFLIEQLSHEPQAKHFFHGDQLKQKLQPDLQSIMETQKQYMYNYLQLYSQQKYRARFQSVFEPFFCKDKVQTSKIKYEYRKFSQPQLLKKSRMYLRNNTEEKQVYIARNNTEKLTRNPTVERLMQKFDIKTEKQPKEIYVNWETLKSKSVATLEKVYVDLSKKKYFKHEPDDEVFLRQYKLKMVNQRKEGAKLEERYASDRVRLERKISQLTSEQEGKNRMRLAKLQQKTSKHGTIKTSKF